MWYAAAGIEPAYELVDVGTFIDLVDAPNTFVGRAKHTHRTLGFIPTDFRGTFTHLPQILIRPFVLAPPAEAGLLPNRVEVMHHRGLEPGSHLFEAVSWADEK